MSSFWVPWRENPERFQLKGAKAVVWAIPLFCAALFRRFPNMIFWGLAALAVLLVWVHAELLNLMNSYLNNPSINLVQEHSWFGGELSLAEIQRGLQPLVGQSAGWIAYPLYPLGHELIRDLVGLGGILGIVSMIPLFTIWWERKVSAHIQNRLGPMRVGGWHGWTQSLADGVKLIAKEDFIPPYGDGPLFRLAPYLAFVPSIAAFIFLPFGTLWVFRNTELGLLLVLAMLGVEVMSVIVAGWASNNKWSMYGGMREAAQMVSYEIPMGMALMLPVLTMGTLDLSRIGESQSGGWFNWLVFSSPLMFATALVYFITSLASVKRAPFDMAEAESELVAGFLTEYSGFRWSMFFFGEYCAMFVVSGLATLLFFGGWYSPLPAEWVTGWATSLGLGGVWRNAFEGVLSGGPLWFIFKSVTLIYVQMWVRWTLPRIRIDQLLYACIQVLLPLLMVLLLGQTLWVLLVPTNHPVYDINRFVLGVIGAVLVLSFKVAAVMGYLRRRQLVGYLAIDALPGA
ncbi:MAG: NAD(P)H-quinone oxidoreductase subunit 1, chloroplastic [Phycisphaerae bacterium]|nr:NAD(P)H-quinone oxidoreductase subunit 1, chloroplastic [Phycisphaerae bacterium]